MNYRALLSSTSVAALAVLAAPAAFALEPFTNYDNFSGAVIKADRWLSHERSRVVKNSALNVVQRDWGPNSGNAGTFGNSFNTSISNPAPVTQFKASIKVNAIESVGCAGNPTPTNARARLIGSFFNTGTPIGGNSTGDVLSQVRIYRLSNSTDPVGVLKVDALAIVCQNSDCSLSSVIGSVVPMGTVNVGTATTVQMEWDRPNKRFLYSRDSGAFSGQVAYTLSDTAVPGILSRSLATRTDVAYCTSLPQPTAFVDATFDAVAVNRSAIP